MLVREEFSLWVYLVLIAEVLQLADFYINVAKKIGDGTICPPNFLIVDGRIRVGRSEDGLEAQVRVLPDQFRALFF